MKELTQLQKVTQSQTNAFLIAEDCPIDVEIVRGLLDEAYSGQFLLDAVESLSEVRSALTQKNYNALILDMNLSGQISDSCIVELSESNPETPIVVLTAETDPAVAIDVLKLGAQDFLTKSAITPQVLARSLRYAQERKKIELALRSSAADIADRNAQLNDLVHTDYLTKLANRAHFENALESMLKRAGRGNQRFALLYIDLNNFKKVNDNFGHAIGDKLLIQVSRRLQETVRSSDFIARIGGDEFIIFTDFLKETNEVYQLLDRATKVFHNPFFIDGKEIQATPAVGVSFYPEANSAEMLLKHADFAMYEGKHQRVNASTVCFYTKETEDKYDRRLKIEAQFDSAIKNQEFTAHFQKVTSLTDGTHLGFEALLRWKSETLGDVSPGEFIPIFESSPVINQLTKVVLKQAKELIDKLTAATIKVDAIKVNITASQLSTPNFCALFLSWLDNEQIPYSAICIEITESQMIKNTEFCLEQIVMLRQAGVKVALDDFGAGYSSLQYLLDFSVDYLKLDISLIRNIHEKKRSQALVAGIVEMSHRLNMKIVAEGVETREEFECCQALKCDLVQGFFLHRPQPINTIVLMEGSASFC